MLHIHRNDNVVVLRGKDRGKKGRVLSVDMSSGRAIVEAANLIKRHVKPSPTVRQAGIVEKPGSLAVANLKLICPKCSKPARVGHKMLPAADVGDRKSRHVRVCKACNEQIE